MTEHTFEQQLCSKLKREKDEGHLRKRSIAKIVMSIKSCIYRNCENYINTIDKASSSKPNITLFQFPKNPERRQIWIERGKAPTNLPLNYYYYCSDHFDKCFLNVGPRRTMLVGEAVPFAFETTGDHNAEDTEEFITPEKNEYFYHLKDDEYFTPAVHAPQEQDLHVESTTMQDSDIHFINNDIHLDEGNEAEIMDTKDSDEAKIVGNPYKRKLHNATSTVIANPDTKIRIIKCRTLSTEPSSPSKPKIPSNPSKMENKVKNDQPNVPPQRGENAIAEKDDVALLPLVINAESVIDRNKVTTFIFKGEEYVQMPKEHYIKEKIALMTKLKKMEIVIANIKKSLKSL